jgi:hypothetical protein
MIILQTTTCIYATVNFANYSGGLSMYVAWQMPYTNNTIDYCNLYATGPLLARYGNEYATLQDLQTGTNQNLHGVSAETLVCF